MSRQHYDDTFGLKPPQYYERYFVPVIGKPVALDLLDRAALQPGENVLDVACGTGIVACLALQKVGDTGSVTGLDINAGMLTVARSTHPNTIEWHEAGADKMPFSDGTFDVVFCQMGLQFMEDRPAALKEMYRVLNPGGRVILNMPGPACRVFQIMAEELEYSISPEAKGFVYRVFCLNETDKIRQLLLDAGFHTPDLRADYKVLSLPAPEEFLWQYIQSTPLAGVLADADRPAKESLEQRVVKQWEKFVNGGSFSCKQRMVTASARK